jgi:hypothetical protein
MRTSLWIFCCIVVGTVLAEDKVSLPLPDAGNVTLTLDEYNKLVELAAKPPKKLDTPPLPYAIKHADLKLRVENEVVLGTVQLEGEVFRKGVSKVPLSNGITIFDAHQTSKGVPMQQDSNCLASWSLGIFSCARRRTAAEN